MAHCSHCGTLNPDESRYCKSCGTRLSPVSPLHCRKCGASNQVGSVFCHKCGERLAQSTNPSSADNRSTPASPTIPGTPVSSKPTSPSEATHDVPPHHLGTFSTTPPRPPTTIPEQLAKNAKSEDQVPDWLGPIYQAASEKAPPIRSRLIPTHELIRMANALGIEIDYSTLRFWQKRGLVPKPVRGPVDNGRGTRGYYDPSLIDRISFIREIQKTYSMGLDTIREELDRLDQANAQVHNGHNARPYQDRLAELQLQRDVESRRTLLTVMSKALGLDPEEIATIVVRKKDGQTIRLLPGKVPGEGEK